MVTYDLSKDQQTITDSSGDYIKISACFGIQNNSKGMLRWSIVDFADDVEGFRILDGAIINFSQSRDIYIKNENNAPINVEAVGVAL